MGTFNFVSGMPTSAPLRENVACPRPFPFLLMQKPLSNEECEPPNDMTLFEDTPLYALIAQQTRASMKQAYNLVCALRKFQIKKRSKTDKSTYLHLIVNQATAMFEKYSTVADLVPLIYQLGLKGAVVNAQNSHGNTCLHLACLRPNAHSLCIHLLRLGVDPCIANNKGIRIVHTYHDHVFQLVKGETSVQSGLWYAVQAENVEMVEKLMKSWCRVNVTRNKSIMDLADDTSNEKLVKILTNYQLTNEVACAAFACDVPLIHSLAKQGPVNWQQRDGAYDLAKPLVVPLGELGFWTNDVIKALISYGATSYEEFKEEEIEHKKAFEKSEFFQLVIEETKQNIAKAADLILEKKVNVKLRSYSESMPGWNYLHFVAQRFNETDKVNGEVARLLVRCVYRLAMAGIDVNARTESGDTALTMSAAGDNQVFIHHLLRIGCDSTIANARGECIAVENYSGRGKLILTRHYRPVDLPGLHAAVKLNSLESVERWLKAWGRVKCNHGDRKLIDVAMSKGQEEIVKLLREYLHLNEFVCATLASDYHKVMNIIALGDGQKKVNAVDEFYPTGHILNFRCEFITRPLIVSAIELSTPQIVDFLLMFKANLSDHYEEKPPCGPLAFWAFQNHVSNEITLVVVKHAEVTLRDELGCTMLHRIITKNREEGKLEVIKILLARNVNIAARDEDGHTARDYTVMYPALDPTGRLRQVLDDHVLELVKLDNLIELEQLVLNSYDHICDIKDSLKHKNAMEIAEIKQYYEMQMFLKKIDSYSKEIRVLQEAVMAGDTVAVSKHAMERKCAQSTDKGGRTLLHLAVLFERLEIIKYLLDHFPNLINRADNLGRTALHYCVCLKNRLILWPPLQDAGAEPSIADVSNLTVYDYVKQLKNPVPKRLKSRARLWRDYTPSFDLIDQEKMRSFDVEVKVQDARTERKKLSSILVGDDLLRVQPSCMNNTSMITMKCSSIAEVDEQTTAP